MFVFTSDALGSDCSWTCSVSEQLCGWGVCLILAVRSSFPRPPPQEIQREALTWLGQRFLQTERQGEGRKRRSSGSLPLTSRQELDPWPRACICLQKSRGVQGAAPSGRARREDGGVVNANVLCERCGTAGVLKTNCTQKTSFLAAPTCHLPPFPHHRRGIVLFKV